MTPAERPPHAEGRTLFFIEPGGTNGGAIRSALGRTFEEQERLFVYSQSAEPGMLGLDDVARFPPRRRGQIRLLMGDFSFGLHERWKRPSVYVAQLRDPIDRILSLYARFLESSGASGKHAGPVPISLEEYVHGQRRLSADNGLTRVISGRSRVGFGSCSEALLEEALRNVEAHFEGLLVAEEMEASLARLEAVVGRSIPRLDEDALEAVPAALPEVEPAELERMREFNQYDLRLYAIARERLLDADAEAEAAVVT